jgi:hypothetical protein
VNIRLNHMLFRMIEKTVNAPIEEESLVVDSS